MGGKGGTVWLISGLAAFVAALAVGIGTLVMVASFVGTGGSSQAASTGGADAFASCTGDPFTKQNYAGGDYKEFVPLYQAAAKKFKLGPQGPSILASIHEHESGFRGSAHGADSSVGAQGPMQFMPETWSSYGVDANGDGNRDIHDPEDAIFAAAKYLKASGAPGDWRTAIFAYNHADWYVNMILDGAKQYEDKIPPCT